MLDQLAPEWVTSQWFNSPPLTLADLRGRIVVLGTFQMLCPGCVANGLPQLQRVERMQKLAGEIAQRLHADPAVGV